MDDRMRTSDPDIFAAGDCCSYPVAVYGGRRVRLESWRNAQEQGNVAAANMLGKAEAFDAVPWFWSDQADLKLQIAGLSSGYDQTVIRGDQAADKFSVLYYKNGSLLAIDAVNDVSDYMAVRRALNAGANIPADAAADSSIPLKTLITGGEA